MARAPQQESFRRSPCMIRDRMRRATNRVPAIQAESVYLHTFVYTNEAVNTCCRSAWSSVYILPLASASRTTSGVFDVQEGNNRIKKGDTLLASTGIIFTYVDTWMRDWGIHLSHSWEVLTVHDDSSSLCATAAYKVRSAGNAIIRLLSSFCEGWSCDEPVVAKPRVFSSTPSSTQTTERTSNANYSNCYFSNP
jgi:hypothetical protein